MPHARPIKASRAGKGAAAVARFLKLAYAAEGFAHLLLLGSIEAIPSPIGANSKASCDNCYAFITSDHAVDFFVSRVTGEQAAAQIDKIAKYEMQSSPERFVKTAWGIASNQSDKKPPTPTHPTDCTRVHGYKSTLLASGLYEKDTVECDPYATTGLGKKELIAGLDYGHSLVTYLGHGAGHSWVMTGFSVDDAHQLTNSYKNPIILDGSCNCGDFGHTTPPFKHGAKKCLAEAMMEGNKDVPGSGAVAMFSSAPTAQWARA